MTTQVLEQLTYNGTIFPTISEPLRPYLESNNIQLPSQSSACWRGYIGHWTIEDNQLYVTDIRSFRIPTKGITPSIQYLFPDQTRVFAEWFSGKIRIEEGEIRHYFGRGHYARERTIFLIFERGVLIESEIIHHPRSS